jgi:hypothetical protein
MSHSIGAYDLSSITNSVDDFAKAIATSKPTDVVSVMRVVVVLELYKAALIAEHVKTNTPRPAR